MLCPVHAKPCDDDCFEGIRKAMHARMELKIKDPTIVAAGDAAAPPLPGPPK